MGTVQEFGRAKRHAFAYRIAVALCHRAEPSRGLPRIRYEAMDRFPADRVRVRDYRMRSMPGRSRRHHALVRFCLHIRPMMIAPGRGLCGPRYEVRCGPAATTPAVGQ